MAAILGLRAATVVIVGDWNATILNKPEWIARNLLEKPEGAQLTIYTVLVGPEVAPGQIEPKKKILLFEEFGLCCSSKRLELFCGKIESPEPLYSIASCVSKALPHTPVRAVGVNFHFLMNEEEARVSPRLETAEAMDEVGGVLSSSRTDAIRIPDGSLLRVNGFQNAQTILKLARSTDCNLTEIDFNYESPLDEVDALRRWTQADPVSHWWRHAKRVMAGYGLDDLESRYY